MCNHGKVLFKYGTINYGKSMHLLATAYNFQEHNIPFMVLKSEIDDRDGENVIHSRALGDRECVSIGKEANIYELVATYTQISGEKLKWILVDEAQFLSEEQVEELVAIADNMGINIICYGLRTDFKTRLFPASKRLFELADSVEEIKSSCYCGSKTIVNARVNSERQIVTEGAQVEVGGDDRYVSLCRRCYFTKIGHKLYKKEEEE